MDKENMKKLNLKKKKKKAEKLIGIRVIKICVS